MSQELISRSADLLRLREEGYEIDVVGGHLLVKRVPYVTAQREVGCGTLVSALNLAGEQTARPRTHVVFFVGEQPCHKDGSEIQQIKHQQAKKRLASGLTVDRSFSNKPSGGPVDYYEKMTVYANIISAPAESLNPQVTAKTFVVGTSDDDSVFEYTDSATTRAEIGAVSARLAGHEVAIIGLGGTGSYVLDLVAKTPVEEIHLFDGDRFLQHNAFRSPGAPSLAELRRYVSKVDYFAAIYSRMHRGIVVHPDYVGSENAFELAKMDFVFLCIDSGSSRKALTKALRDQGKPFIDVGMGVDVVEVDGERALVGMLRVSTSTPSQRDGERRIPISDSDPDQDYNTNIQVADLNCLNAALAVVRWKKLCGFYQDLENEHFTAYAVNVNQLVSEEC